MENFTPVASAVGGVLIGLSALALLAFAGRIAGISGIVGGLVGVLTGQGMSGWPWKLAFLGGLLAGGVGTYLASPESFAVEVDRSAGALVLAGLLVGIGTRMGGGCTSGHGVCGVSRLSKRSLVATCTFMATGALTVFVVKHWLGGAV
jgi:uncharacterized membrane protein YedE/YeeE